MEYVGQFVVCVGSFGSAKAQDVGDAASCVGFDTFVLVQENALVDELAAHATPVISTAGTLIQLFQLGEFSVEDLEFLEENICGCRSPEKFLLKLELPEMGLSPAACLSHHDARG